MWRQPPSAVRPRERPNFLPELKIRHLNGERRAELAQRHGSSQGSPCGRGTAEAAVPTQKSLLTEDQRQAILIVPNYDNF